MARLIGGLGFHTRAIRVDGNDRVYGLIESVDTLEVMVEYFPTAQSTLANLGGNLGRRQEGGIAHVTGSNNGQ